MIYGPPFARTEGRFFFGPSVTTPNLPDKERNTTFFKKSNACRKCISHIFAFFLSSFSSIDRSFIRFLVCMCDCDWRARDEPISLLGMEEGERKELGPHFYFYEALSRSRDGKRVVVVVHFPLSSIGIRENPFSHLLFFLLLFLPLSARQIPLFPPLMGQKEGGEKEEKKKTQRKKTFLAPPSLPCLVHVRRGVWRVFLGHRFAHRKKRHPEQLISRKKSTELFITFFIF